MQRINTPDNLYHDADPLNGVAGTVVTATALNAIQEEIVSVITAAGIPLNPASNSQLYDAIMAITGGGSIAWGAITGKPSTYPPTAHDHAWADITDPPDTATRWAAWGEVTGKPLTFTPAAHDHAWADITDPPATATRWPAWNEVTEKPALAPVALSGNYADLIDVPALGSMAAQDANNVNISGGIAAFTGNVSTTNSVLAGAKAALYTDANTNVFLSQADNPTLGFMASFTGRLGIRETAASKWLFVVDAAGASFDGQVTAPGFATTASSRAVKHDIAPCRYGLAEFLHIPWVEYRYNPEITADNRLRFGSIVEDVAPFAPELVIERPGQVPTFEYDQFIPVLGRALQQYIARTDGRMAGMQREMQELAERLANMERGA